MKLLYEDFAGHVYIDDEGKIEGGYKWYFKQFIMCKCGYIGKGFEERFYFLNRLVETKPQCASCLAEAEPDILPMYQKELQGLIDITPYISKD